MSAPAAPEGLERILLRVEQTTTQELHAIRSEVGDVSKRVTHLHERVVGGATDGPRPLLIRVEDLERTVSRLESDAKAEAEANLVDKRSAGADALRWLVISIAGALVTSAIGALVAWMVMR